MVSVICVCYNHVRFVTEALDSVIAQTHQPIELIVIDDGSTDGSPNEIKQWIAKHPETTVLLNDVNLGYCMTFNKAAGYAKGKYLIDLSADDRLMPDRIKIGVQVLESMPMAGVTFSDAEYISETGDRLRLHSDRFAHHTIPSGNIYKELIERFFICSPTMMFSRAVYAELGGYDELLDYEDFDFWIRSSRNFQYFYTPQVLVKKRVVSGSLSHTQFAFRSKHSVTTLRVCEKILELNQTPDEQKALQKRIRYEILLNLKLGNCKVVGQYLMLGWKNFWK